MKAEIKDSVNDNGLLDLASFEPDNVSKLMPWREWLLSLVAEWPGRFFFSQPELSRVESAKNFLKNSGISSERIEKRIWKGEEVSHCLSFRLLGKGEKVERPSDCDLYWAFGGLEARDWIDQWRMLESMSVKGIYSELFPEELPSAFEWDERLRFAKKMLFVSPVIDRSSIQVAMTKDFGKILYKEEALQRRNHLFAESICEATPRGEGQGRLIMLDHPQWIHACCSNSELGNTTLLAFPNGLSPSRWGMLGGEVGFARGFPKQYESMRKGVESLRQNPRWVKVKGSKLEKPSLFPLSVTFSGALCVHGFYEGAEKEIRDIAVAQKARSGESNSCFESAWWTDPVFLGALISLLKLGRVNELLFGISDWGKAVVLLNALHWAEVISDNSALVVIEDCIRSVRPVDSIEGVGRFLWGAIEQGVCSENDLHATIARLKDLSVCELKLGTPSRELSSLGVIASIFDEAPDNWNYANYDYLCSLVWIGRLAEVKEKLVRLRREFPDLVGYRTNFGALMISPFRSRIMNQESRQDFAAIIELAKYCFEMDWVEGRANENTISEIAWLWGILGDEKSFENLLKRNPLGGGARFVRIQFALYSWGSMGRTSDWLISNGCERSELDCPYETLVLAFLGVVIGNCSLLERLVSESPSCDSFAFSKECREPLVPPALLLFGLNVFCGFEQDTRRIRTCLEKTRKDLVPYAERIESVVSKGYCVSNLGKVWVEKLNRNSQMDFIA